MRAWALAALAIALVAGCAGDPQPLVVGEPTFSDAQLPPGMGLAPLEWRVLSESPFTIAPVQPFSAGVVIPNGTLGVYANMTLARGAAYGLGVHVGSCLWQRDVALVGQGQEVVADCGGILEGPETLELTTQAGALSGDVRLVGLVCSPLQGVCPGRLPVPER